MSRFHPPASYGGQPNTHLTHPGANSSNVNINRQAANTNKYEKASPQTNSNKYDQQNQPQIPLNNVASQQQQQQLQQKNKLVNSDYQPIVPGTHHGSVALPHNNYRISNANSSYPVTASVNYSQNVPPQPPPTALPISDRQIGQQHSQQTSQQLQDHKMQPSQSSQPFPFNTYQPVGPQRGQQRLPMPGSRMNNIQVVGRQQQQGQGVPQTQQIIYMPQVSLQTAHYPNSNPTWNLSKHPNQVTFYSPLQYFPLPLQAQQQQRLGAAATQHIPTLNTGVTGAGSTQIQSHQQQPHQINQQLHLQAPPFVMQPRQQQSAEAAQKRPSKRIPIINPDTNEEVEPSKVNSQNSSGSNPHSSALKVEAPSSSQITNQPHQTHQKSLNEPTCDTSNEPEQSTIDHSNIENQAEASSSEEPPHTPVVSAIADAPSVDIMPKQSKNVKRTNKSPEWQMPSAEKTSTETVCDNYSKVASSLGNTTSSTSNECVKTNQTAPKVSNESDHKDSQQKHNPKVKHSAHNHNIAPQSNKGKAASQPDNITNMVANLQQPAPAPASTKEQPASEPKPVAPVAAQSEQTKVETTNTGRNVDKPKQPIQSQVEKVHSEEREVSKSNKEKATDTTMSNSSSMSTPTETVEIDKTKIKTVTNTSIDETDKLINSLDSMSISNKEIKADKNDKLDAKSVEFNNNSQKQSL